MMDLSLKEFIQIVFTVFGAALTSYMAIRNDLAVLKSRMDSVENESGKAHGRIDGILMERRK